MRKHYELRAWQNAMQLVQNIYRITNTFPSDEKFGLTNQLRRAAVSVPSNIAEGAARGSDADFLRFLYMSRGSLSEIETQLLIARDLGFVNDFQEISDLIENTFAQLGGLIKHLEHKKMTYVKEEDAAYSDLTESASLLTPNPSHLTESASLLTPYSSHLTESASPLTPHPSHLTEDTFKQILKNAPLFSIDLVVLNEQNQILLGKRNNPPAKGYWFVPGGRVFKNEALASAFERICQTELRLEYPYTQAKLLGLYDHFYQDSVFGDEIDTHYINAPYLINLDHTQGLNLPTEQHLAYRWLSLDKLEQDNTVHPNSKIFMEALKTAQGLNEHD